MPTTSRMTFPYPADQQDPWYDSFVGMVNALDSSCYAAREDRQIVIMGGGTISFTIDLGTDIATLSWNSSIYIASPLTGFVWSIAPGSKSIVDGQMLYVNLVRAPTDNLTLTPVVSNQVPSSDEAFLIGVRKGPGAAARFYFRNGKVLAKDDSFNVLETSAGGSGGGSGGGTTGERVTVVYEGTTVTGPKLLQQESFATISEKDYPTVKIPGTGTYPKPVFFLYDVQGGTLSAGQVDGVLARGTSAPLTNSGSFPENSLLYSDGSGGIQNTVPASDSAYLLGRSITDRSNYRVVFDPSVLFRNSTLPANAVIDTAGTNGAVTALARSDHAHRMNTYSSAATALTDSSAASGTSGVAPSRGDHVHSHGTRGGGALHSLATQAAHGFLSYGDKAKIDALAAVGTVECLIEGFEGATFPPSPHWSQPSLGYLGPLGAQTAQTWSRSTSSPISGTASAYCSLSASSQVSYLVWSRFFPAWTLVRFSYNVTGAPVDGGLSVIQDLVYSYVSFEATGTASGVGSILVPPGFHNIYFCAYTNSTHSGTVKLDDITTGSIESGIPQVYEHFLNDGVPPSVVLTKVSGSSSNPLEEGGVLKISTAATSSDYCYLDEPSVIGCRAGRLIYEIRLKLDGPPVATTALMFGLIDPNTLTSYVMFLYDPSGSSGMGKGGGSSNWQAISKNGSTEEYIEFDGISRGLYAPDNKYHVFNIILESNRVDFGIDGDLGIYFINTMSAYLPALDTLLGHTLRLTTYASAAKAVSIDYLIVRSPTLGTIMTPAI